MAKKKTEIELDDILESAKEKPVEVDSSEKEIKEDDLVATPVEEVPLQTFANRPAQPFNPPQRDVFRGVGGSYYIDSQGNRVKRTN